MNFETLSALLSLTGMEIILGIDNIVFIALLVGNLPERTRFKTQRLGLFLALLMRIGLLFSITYLMGISRPIFTISEFEVSAKSLILILGGFFLIAKATIDIREKFEERGKTKEKLSKKREAKVFLVLIQIVLLDMVFSLDSVITAIGMVKETWVIVVAMTLAMMVMLLSASHISVFVNRHPSVKILALSFLILIGILLIAEGTGTEFDKGYVYAAMSFSIVVELLNIRYKLSK